MALVTAAPDTTRRHVLLIGTATYLPGWPDISAGVRQELDSAKRLFVDKLGYDTCRELVNPDSSTLKKEVARWRLGADKGPNDWLVLYYTGHGVERAGMLQLITTDIEADSAETAPTAQDLVMALVGARQPSHILLIVDTCQSGAAQLDVTSTAARLREAQGGAARGADFHVITTARSIDNAWVGQFIDALDVTMTNGTAASTDEDHVQLGPALEKVNEILATADVQRSGFAGAGERASRFLPNPKWVPRLQKAMESDARERVLYRIQSIALRSHWNPRARGVATEHDVGWFFTGRSRVLRRIVQWLAADDAAPALVIKGLPGSGKSAVLARIVTLADSQARNSALESGALSGITQAEIPCEGAIDAAIHARAKDPVQLALEMSAALRLDASGGQTDAEAATIEALRGRADRLVVAIDALDEAQRPYDCAAFLRRLLQKAPSIRLLIGVRSSGTFKETLVDALGPQIDPLDLDAPDWYDKADISSYVQRYVAVSPNSACTTLSPHKVRQLAERVSERAGKSFLIAVVTAHALAGRTAIPTLDAIEDRLPSTVGEALELDLARFSGSAGLQVRAVLWALAWAFGRGLPRAEWLALARVHSDDDMSESDLERWSREAGFYIVTDEEFGTPVWRLYHEEFALHLKSKTQLRAYHAIPHVLLNLVPRVPNTTDPAWQAASNYLLMYYPAYLVLLHGLEFIRLTTGSGWIEAKRRRFISLEPVLVDLDQAAHQAHLGTPDLPTAVRVCAVYTRFATVAPPLAIDVLAALGQLGFAELTAKNIEFPLDRCHAFSLLAIRNSKARNAAEASNCLRLAERAASVVRGHFSTMALYWVTHAALESGLNELSIDVAKSVRASLDKLIPEEPNATLTWMDAAKLNFQLWVQDRWEEDKAFAVPHWLFWAAMCLREVGDEQGLAKIRETLAALSPLGTNLALQTAAIARDQTYLRSVKPGGIVKPRNLALALVEAGLVGEFDALRRDRVFDSYDFADAAKRYAWALACRGDSNSALEVADSIQDDLEERARAYFRLSQVALRNGDRPFADAIASRAAELLGSLSGTGSPRLPRWRVESWIAPVMLAADRRDEARKLAESVCNAGVAPTRENSLAMATPRTAYSKGHVRFDSTLDVDEGVVEGMLQLAATAGTPSAINAIKESEATMRTKALSLAALASVHPDPAEAYSLWLDALMASRLAGRKILMDVIAKGTEVLSRALSPFTPGALHAIIAAVDSEFATSDRDAGSAFST
jgi:hypothetical protein